MSTTALSLALAAFGWYRAHAVAVFAAAVVGAIVLETAHRLWRRSQIDVAAATTSLVSGAAFLLAKNVVSKLAMLSLSMWVFHHHRLFDADLSSPLVWVGMFVLRDFIYYWVHRTEHRVRVLWASHLVHHSPERIGFTTAVRVPWMEAVYKPWLSLWVPLLGFNPLAFIALDILAATIGQLQHTEACRRRTVLDSVFVTPSAHRVHHGSNDKYIDKNFGAVLIVWDRMFGTYEPEVEPVVYGIGREHAIDTPYEALVGGYPELFRQSREAVRSSGSLTAGVRHLVSAPG
jgi:alkylglycerol monooxygenase